ncbi:hypothetical protein ABB37_08409 [Leptomonas pyrrhocoris]|uniref:C-type lectin domain-containing protein n=1 Tax=Leptomonas pyrrhocoris TaxID=157538 RepID=A0A0N0DS30_LEPPY|nr:hypothetical protein ABB37_08409 [Leptomonas pyrrhocoris]KPA75512.1 hypothetical protein ABB37_08409 [Leptomonas pyrrhocoris]|eukprot:XP_015653951.1 hypothetical protein ABB37_08409 [Leptomonas pyrrhocoris]
MHSRDLSSVGGGAFAVTPAPSHCQRRRLFLLIAAAAVLFAVVPAVVPITQVHAASSAITCPYGWFLYEARSNNLSNAHDVAAAASYHSSSSSVTRQCVRVFATSSVPANSAESACEAVFTSESSVAGRPFNADGVTPWPFARHVSPHGAAIFSAEENSFLHGLFLQVGGSGVSDDTVLILGGVAGYGLVDWYAGGSSTAASTTYTNFADDVNWQLHAGTVVMRPSGTWGLLPANSIGTTAYPFACAFDASGAVVTPDSSSTGPAASSSAPASSSAHAESSSKGEAHPGRKRAHRPAVPQPAPACLDGWTPLPSVVDTSEGADNTVCYRLFANASEAGGRLGRTFEAAQAYCRAAHPKAALASVMSRSENEWIVSTLLSRVPVVCDGDGAGQASTSFSSTGSITSSSGTSARTVFLGGSYMRDGAGAGLIGSWYADQHLFNASEFAATSPSSPAWPTARNDYFANWAAKEPLLSYGVVGITPPAQRCNTGSGAAATAKTTSAADTSAGTWVGLDPRSTQPFLCSYLNDGSAFPTPPPPTTPTPDPNSTTTAAPGPSGYCVPGWSFLPLTSSCYRVYPIATTTTAITTFSSTAPAVTPATMEEACEQVLRGRVVAAKVARVRAVSMQSIAESNYIGALLQRYIDSDGGDTTTTTGSNAERNTSAVPVSLAGISFIDSGNGGFYISGVRELDPQLALSLWAASEPAAVKGCIAVDVHGLWHYVPCSAAAAGSMPDSTAVYVTAYTCQYNATEIDPAKDVLHPTTTTTTPEPTSGPGWSSESGSSGEAWPPLEERIAALSNAAHLVVAAGSTGIYTLQGPNATTPAAASVRGLHLYFAPLSALYSYAVPTVAVDGTAMGSIFAPAQGPPSSLSDLLVLSPNASVSRPFAPCEGYKDQSRINRVRLGTVTVRHGNTSEVGYVCVSQDGVHYVPTAITYEVTEVTVHGFIPTASRTRHPASVDARPTWLPPLLCSRTASSPNSVCAVQRTLAIPQHGTGTVQLALRYSSDSKDDVVVTAQSPTVDTMVSHVRLSATADCMGAEVPFYLLAPDMALQQVPSARYTRRNASTLLGDRTGDARSGLQFSVLSYQYATIRAARLSSLKPLYNSSTAPSELATLQPPVEFYVCVAVQKTHLTNTSAGNSSSADVAQAGAASRRLLSLWNITSSSTSSGSSSRNSLMPALWSSSMSTSSSAAPSHAGDVVIDGDAFLLSIVRRLAARTSLSPVGAAVRTYTAVPGLKAHIVPKEVAVKGMWALPPRRLTHRVSSSNKGPNDDVDSSSSTSDASADLATLVPTPATFNRSAHYRLRPTYAYTYGSSAQQQQQQRGEASPVASLSHLHVSQYSSPILLLDGQGIQPGMLALLSQDPNSCNRLQPVPRTDPTAAAATWPRYLDTMVPLSTATMRVESENINDNSSATTTTMAYMQLNLNHTGLWGHHPTRTDDVAATTQTWYVCIAYDPLSPFLPLRNPALRITVHRLQVERFAIDANAVFTSSDAVVAAEAADATTTHLNLNTGFAGMLWMHGVDVRLWATTTLHSAQVVFSVVLPSNGTVDDTAEQCAHSNLFYSQRGLGVLTQDSRRRRRSGGSSSSTSDEDSVDTSLGMVIPLGFFTQQSTRRMQLCLSVPLPFSPVANGMAPPHRFFAPVVNTTLDVGPIQLLYMGRYSAIPSPSSPTLTTTTTTSGTVIRLAEGVRDVVLPLTGYGIRPDMTMFLSSNLCHGVSTVSSDVSRIVASQSLLNVSVVSLYDLPSSYWNTSASVAASNGSEQDGAEDGGRGRVHRPRLFVVLRHDDLLSKSAAQHLFRQDVTIDPLTGAVTTTRVPLNVCLYAPGTATLVFPTNFQLVVDPPRVTAIRNLPSDAGLIAQAVTGVVTAELSQLTPTAATVVYAGNMDLVVEGFGLDDTNTWLMPALDCRNASSFLWRAPVQLSALPSSQTTFLRIEKNAAGTTASPLYADSSRYVDPQTSFSSWFASLRQQETVRFGSDTSVSSGQVVHRFQWCVRIAEDGETTTASATAAATETTSNTSGYVSAGIPYQLVLPAIHGFALENARRGAPPSTTLVLPTQHLSNGRWFPMQLVGPLVDVVDEIGSPLHLFLAPEAYTCHAVKNSYLHQGLDTFRNASSAAVNGSAVLLPRLLTTAGSYRLCASAVYPTLAAADDGVEAALQFFNLDGLRVELVQAVYGVFALNHTTTVTVEQGQEWTLPISGSMLTNRSVVRFQTSADLCGEPMVATKTAGGGKLPDIPIQNDFTGFALFGQDDASSELEGGTSVIVHGYYIVLSQNLIRALAAPAAYVLCLQPQRSLAWRAAPSITLNVMPHVRRPTHYRYFPADGSEDVAALTALAPTKVALEWNTGEVNTVNIVGAAGQQVSLALWCLPPPNASSSFSSFSSTNNAEDSSARGVEEELVPCGDHRRVMFVKPLDGDGDPCFVDAEAVPEDVLRGPYVLDFGVLTLPHSLSVADGATSSDSDRVSRVMPNMTQPWIMCLETAAERWREPTYPMLQLQYTRAIPTSFRLRADDASNTTAPFPAHKSDVEAVTTAEMDRGTGIPIGGNTTLFLYAQDGSQVVYLNGYGIERGHKLRFGSFCEEEMAPPDTSTSNSSSKAGPGSSGRDSADDNSTSASSTSDYLARVSEWQELANPRLYAEPLTIEDDNGVFLVPNTHLLESEDARNGSRGIPVCLSTNDGHTYKRTSLRLRVLSSRLQTDTETRYRNLLEEILSNTLLVPQHSRGSVDLSELVRVAKGLPYPTNASTDSTNSTSQDSRTVPTPTPVVYVRVGTQVLLSASCSVNTHGLPLLTVNVPNTITLTKNHTAAVTGARLLLCFRNVDAAASATAAQRSDASNAENEMGAVTSAFQWYGVYYRVMAVQVDQVSLHAWTPTEAMRADNVNHVVLRRGGEEDLLLRVLMGATPSASPSSASSSSLSNDLSPQDELLQRIQRSPSAMSLLSLARLYVGRPCYRPASAPPPVTAVSPYVASYAGMQLWFSADAVSVAPLLMEQHASDSANAPSAAAAGNLNESLVASLPSGDGLPVPQFPLTARGSVCLSVDGGRQYLAVGIAQYTEDWAPTLRVSLDTEDDENREDVAEEEEPAAAAEEESSNDGGVAVKSTRMRGTTTAMRVYALSSTARRLTDTRFVVPRLLTNESGSILQVLADLGQLTTTMLWSGFIGDDGFAMDGLLYLPASSKVAQTGTQQQQQQPQPLRFSLDNRLQNLPTNLTLTVVPWSLTCYGASSQRDVFVRPQDVGLHTSTAPGVCSAGVRDGVRVRVVPMRAAACDDPTAVDASYVMDLPTVQLGSWGALTTPSSASPFRAMQLPMSLRYVPDGTYALCLRQDLPFVSTLQPMAKMTSDAPETTAAATMHTAVYAATPLRLHVSRRWTILSISDAAISEEEEVGSSTSTSANSVVALAQSSNAELAVAGTAVEVRGVPLLLAFAPSAAQRVTRRLPSLSSPSVNSSSSSNTSSAANETVMWSNGCAGVPESWDPLTGASLLVRNDDSAAGSGKLLSTPWYNAQDGVWKVDAAYLQEVEWQTQSSNKSALVRYMVCYSVDEGLSFHPAGVALDATTPSSNGFHSDSTHTAAATSAISFTAVVVPPTITSLSASRAAAVVSFVDATPEQLQWAAVNATATAVRVQLLSTSAAADSEITTNIPHVVSFSRVDGASGSVYAARPHRYDYVWTSAFVGNGVGPASGRGLPVASSPSSSLLDVPTVAAAVALVRTSLHGARCDGAHAVPELFTVFRASNSTDAWRNATPTSPLAAPIFVVNLQHGGVWSSADTAAVEAWRGAQASSARLAAFDKMNAVLGHADWVKSTAEMWTQNTSGTTHTSPPINGPLLLGRAATEAAAAARSNGESILVCLSTDGTRFYSADVARAAFASAGEEDPQQWMATVSAATASSTAAVRLSPWPLYLRARAPATRTTTANTTTTTPALLWMRETSMVMELLARPASNSSSSTPSSSSSSSLLLTIEAASLTRFQNALAKRLGVEAAVVVVQLAHSGDVTLPQRNTSTAAPATTTTTTTSTTTSTTAAPVQPPVLRQTPAAVDEVRLFAVQAVQARHRARAYATAEGAAVEATSGSLDAPQLPTYALVVTIAADAVVHNATANTAVRMASPELLYRAVAALRSNVSGPALLTTLVPRTARAALALYPLTVNFTMSNGADLHTAVAVTPAALPASPAQEVAWRDIFLSIPYTTASPEEVPDAEDNDATSKVSWWVIPILLILPAGMVYGTYFVYKKYLKRPESPEAAAQVTVENIQ